MNKLDRDYQALLQDILDNGVKKSDRTGTGTISVFGRQIRHKMSDGFPLLTTKKMYTKGIITELIWFLKGDTNIKYLVDNDCHIWDGDAYKKFFNAATSIKEAYECGDLLGTQPNIEAMFSNPDNLTIFTKEEFIEKIKTDDEFATKWGDLGPIYGFQWRNWGGHDKLVEIGGDSYDGSQSGHIRCVKVLSVEVEGIDQIQNAINTLKTNPDDRGIKVSAWNVGELDQMTLRPCHTDFQFYTRELHEIERLKLLYEELGYDFVRDCVDFYNPTYDELLIEKNIPTRAVSLMWNQRSVDTFLGLPFNIASYGLLLEIVAKEVNMIPDELIGNLGDTHLYLNHIEQAKEQIGHILTLGEREEIAGEGYIERFSKMALTDDVQKTLLGSADWYIKHAKDGEHGTDVFSKAVILDALGVPEKTRIPYKLPTLSISENVVFGKGIDALIDSCAIGNFKILGYQSHPTIKGELSN